jgi:tetratricopeptide (TPR) repeat protein
MVTGEMLSTGLKRWYVQAAKVGNAKNPAEAKANSDFLKEQEGVARLGDLGMAAKWPEWLELYRKLPRAIQTEKSVLLVRLRATRELGDEEGYNTALEEFRKLFPQDACIDFLSIDYYLTKGQHQESLACVDRVDRFLGGDPYLDVIRAHLLADAGDLKAATLAADKAIAAEPDLFDAVASRLSIALKAKDHAATMRYLLHLEKEFGIEFADLTIVPEYAEFVKSPEHKKWLERPKPKPPAEPDQK